MPQHGLASVAFSFTLLVVKSAQMGWPILSARSTGRVLTTKRNVYPVAVSRAVTTDFVVSTRTIEQHDGGDGVPWTFRDVSRDCAARGSPKHTSATAISMMWKRIRAALSCDPCIGA